MNRYDEQIVETFVNVLVTEWADRGDPAYCRPAALPSYPSADVAKALRAEIGRSVGSTIPPRVLPVDRGPGHPVWWRLNVPGVAQDAPASSSAADGLRGLLAELSTCVRDARHALGLGGGACSR